MKWTWLGLSVGALALWSACASGGDRVGSSPGVQANETPIERLSDVVPATPVVNDSAPHDPAPGLAEGKDEDRELAKKKLIEEYKALSLKNDCSGGKKDLEGVWRFVGESRTPDYSSTITITGTRYVEKIGGRPDGKRVDATLTGELRCLFRNRVLVQIDKVVPEGAYGNTSGDLYPCDVLSDMDPKVDRMLMSCYFDWDLRTSMGMDFEFERVETK